MQDGRSGTETGGGESEIELAFGRVKGGTAESMSVAHIHLQAIVAPTAKLGSGVQVGAFAVVGDGVELGDDCVLEPHAVVRGPRASGATTCSIRFVRSAAIPRTSPIRGEHVDWSSATATVSRIRHGEPRHRQGRRRHAHRQRQSLHGLRARRARLRGRQPHLFANGATLAGHVTVEDYATIGRSVPCTSFAAWAATPTSAPAR